MKRIFKTRFFSRWMRKTKLSDATLLSAINEMEQGLFEANLGGGLYKKRIRLPNRGKSSSIRTIIAYNQNEKWFFLMGFEKNTLDNLGRTELVALKELATDLLTSSEILLEKMLNAKALEEIEYDNASKK